MHRVLLIAGHTLLDQLRRRSLYVLLALSLVFIFTLRGCYDGNYTVNGQQLSSASIAWHASLFAFQFIAGSMLLLSVLIATPVFATDLQDGSAVMYLSRPVSRFQYILGRILGLWLLLSACMLVLHGAVFLIAWQKTGGAIPGFLLASLLCAINLFFVVILTSLLSFFMPGFVAAALSFAVIFFGFVSDGGQRLLDSQVVKIVLQGAKTDVAWWRLFYPKVYMLQHYAVTVISRDEWYRFGPVHPLVNVLLYCAVLFVILIFVFDRKDL